MGTRRRGKRIIMSDPTTPRDDSDPEAYNAAEDIDQLLAQDSQVGGEDPEEEGYSPPERPLGLRPHDTLDDRLGEEVGDEPTGLESDDIGDTYDTDGEPLDDEVGDVRSGRLVAPGEGGLHDDEPDLIASDVGIDGGAASAEEAAMHVVDDETEL
jgi:hypothetical protein